MTSRNSVAPMRGCVEWVLTSGSVTRLLRHSSCSAASSERMGRVGFVLAHEQFPAAELVALAIEAEQGGFETLWTSDHFHPWMDNQGHSGQAWVTLAAISQRVRLPFGTGVTCPTFRYRPAVVA